MGESEVGTPSADDVLAPSSPWAGLVTFGTRRALQPGDVLAVEGDAADEVYVVVEGELSAERRSEHGSVVVGKIGAGQIVGEITVIAGGRRTASLNALSPCDVLAVGRDHFERWLKQHGELADSVSNQARDRLDRTHVAAMVTELLGTNDPATVEAVLGRVEWRRLAAGEVLFHQGDAADAAYFVVNGRLLVTRHDDGDEVGGTLLAELGRGDVVGEIGLLDDAPRSATVRAARDSTLAAFSATAFEELVGLSPGLMMHVARGIVDTLRRGRRRTVTRAASLAIAVVADLDVDHLLRVITEELAHFGSVRLLSSAGVDELLNRPGIAQAHAANVGVPRLSEFLHEAEIGNDQLLFLADLPDDDADVVTNWTDRAVRQADRVLVFASAAPTPTERRRIDRLSASLSATPHLSTMLAAVHPPGTDRPTGTPALRRSLGVDEVVHLRRDDDEAIARVARLATGHGVGLVLSGGGARGFGHIGVYQALRAAGIPVDAVGGCSIGAPIGGGMARQVPDDEMVELAERLFHRLLDYTVPVVSLLKGERITASVQEAFADWDIEDLWLPYYCVSTNLTTSALEVHRSGPAATAVRASVSIPGVLPPVPYEGSLLVDGGVLNNLPVEAMVADPRVSTVLAIDVAPATGPRAKSDFGLSVSGARALYSSVTGRGKRYPSVSSVLVRSMLAGAMNRQLTTSAASAVTQLFKVNLPGIGLLDFERVREVVDLGRGVASSEVEAFAAAHPSVVRAPA